MAEIREYTDKSASYSEPAAPPSLTDRVRSLRLPDDGGSAMNFSAWLPWILCGALACVTLYFAVFRAPSKAVEDPDKLAEANAAAKSDVGVGERSPQLSSGEIAMKAKGYIVPISLIQVSPKVGGMVMELYIEEGKRVKAGDLLAELEDIDYRSERDRAVSTVNAAQGRLNEISKYREQEIQQAKAEMDDAKAQLDQLDKDFQRTLSLRLSNSAAQKDIELAESSFRSMQFRMERLKLAYELLMKGPRDAKISSAKAEVEQAKSDLVKAQWRFDNTKVVAPVSGVILTKGAEKGSQVNPVAFGDKGVAASLCQMADLTKMEVDLSIAERDISKIFAGQRCDVRSEAYLDRPYTGRVSRIMPTADRSKGAVPVRVIIDIPQDEEGKFLRPEMGAIVTFYNK